MIEKINYFLDHGMDVNFSVYSRNDIFVTVFNSNHKIIATANCFNYKGYGLMELSIRDHSGREILRLNNNYSTNHTFDVVIADILDMIIRKFPSFI